MGVTLDPDEEAAFLSVAHTGLLTTLRRDGMPVTLPIWFVPMDGAIFCSTPSRSKKVARIRSDERCWFLVERGLAWNELAAVGFAGRVRVLLDGAEAEKADNALNAKYADYRPQQETLPGATQRRYVRQVILKIDPVEASISWDNHKVRPSVRAVDSGRA